MKKRNGTIGRIASAGIVGIALLALGILGAGAALADEGEGEGCDGGRCRGAGGGRLMAMAQELDLSEDQLEKLDRVRELVRERRQDRRERRGAGYSVVLESMEDGEIDVDQVHASIDERMEAKRATAHEVADEMIGFFDSLDAEQRATMLEQMEERRGERRERARRGARCDGDDCECPCQGRRGRRGGPPEADTE